MMEPELKLISAVIVRGIDDACMDPFDRKYSPMPKAHNAMHWLLDGGVAPWLDLLEMDYGQFRERLLERMWSEKLRDDSFRERYRRKFFRRNYELYGIAKQRGTPVPIDVEEEDDDFARSFCSSRNRWNPGWSVEPDL